jgi:hypothetical protein
VELLVESQPGSVVNCFAVAALAWLLSVGACHNQMLARRSSGLTQTYRGCTMVPEVGHAPATIETELSIYGYSCEHCQQEQLVHIQPGLGQRFISHSSA